jgi:nicotinamidase-related amidase
MTKNEKKVLLIIDPQKGFKNKHTEKALERIEEIADYFDIVFASLFHNPENSLYKELLYWHNFAKHKHPEYSELAIQKTPKMRLFKTHKYGNINLGMKSFLFMNKVKKVYICGLETDASVYKTALDLFDMGIEPILIKDACGSCQGKRFHNMGISLAERQIGEDNVLTFDEIKDKLEHKVVELF